MTTGLNELLEAAAKMQALLAKQGWRFCFIGGVAVQRWGNPRFTQDIDLTLLTTCSAEDLLTHKVFAGRELDWGDVEGILTRQHAKLNLKQVRTELGPLLELKGQPEAMDKFDRLVAIVDRRLGAG